MKPELQESIAALSRVDLLNWRRGRADLDARFAPHLREIVEGLTDALLREKEALEHLNQLEAENDRLRSAVGLSRRCLMVSLSSPLNHAPCILVDGVTGIEWTNQVDGESCLHPSTEGWLLPLYLYDLSAFGPNYAVQQIEETINWQRGWRGRLTQFRVLDHPRNCEAWLRCEFDLKADPYSDDSPARLTGWLTWENSD